jgi:alpha-mannosidase
VYPHRGDWRAADCYGAADAYLVPFERARVSGRAATVPAHAQALRVEGAEVSAVTRAPGGSLVVRVFRTESTEGPVTIQYNGTPARGYVVDLRGAPVAPFAGELALRPCQIATVQLS